MTTATSTTSWPSTPIPPAVISLLDRFFAAVDNKSLTVGPAIAACFAPTGKWVLPNITANEQPNVVRPDEIASAPRGPVWEGVAHRRHDVKKVYVCDGTASDLLIMGGLEMRLENGVAMDPGFCARVVLDDSQGDDPRFVLFQGWTDTGPLREAMKAQREWK